MIFYILYINCVGLQPWLDWTLTDLASTTRHVSLEVSRQNRSSCIPVII